MKKRLVITLLLSSVLFSSPSYGEWTHSFTHPKFGYDVYIDFDKIKKRGDNVYFWTLSDLLTPASTGKMSLKYLVRGDCNNFYFSNLTSTSYVLPMGEGYGESTTLSEHFQNIEYPPTTGNNMKSVIKSVCNY
jgi:hypothetical protein